MLPVAVGANGTAGEADSVTRSFIIDTGSDSTSGTTGMGLLNFGIGCALTCGADDGATIST